MWDGTTFDMEVTTNSSVLTVDQFHQDVNDVISKGNTILGGAPTLPQNATSADYINYPSTLTGLLKQVNQEEITIDGWNVTGSGDILVKHDLHRWLDDVRVIFRLDKEWVQLMMDGNFTAAGNLTTDSLTAVMGTTLSSDSETANTDMRVDGFNISN